MKYLSGIDISTLPPEESIKGKKILFLTDIFLPHFAPRLFSWVSYFVRLGASCTVCCEDISVNSRAGHGHVFTNVADPCAVYRFRLRKHYSRWESLSQAFFLAKDKRFFRLIKKHLNTADYDLIIASSYRTFPLYTAFLLSKLYHIPFLADCRDVVEEYARYSFLPGRSIDRPIFYKRWALHLLKGLFIRQRTAILKKATAITTVSPWHRALLSSLSEGVPCYCLFNGYDSTLFYPSPVATERFTILYTGRLMSLQMRDPSLLFDALSDAALEPIVGSGLLEVAWYVDDHSKALLTSLLQDYPDSLRHIQRFYPMVPFEQVPDILRRAGMILLLNNDELRDGPRGMVSTKLFEAMAVGKPILSIPGRSTIVSSILSDAGFGESLVEKHEVMREIEHYFGYWKKNLYTCKEIDNKLLVEQFARDEIASLCARVAGSLLLAKKNE